MTESLSTPQRLALQAVHDGSVDYANPRTLASMVSLVSRGLIVWLGVQSQRFPSQREWLITSRGAQALALASDEPPDGTRTTCTNCGLDIVYDSINTWLHEGVSGDQTPCDVEVPVAEPDPGWDWRDHTEPTTSKDTDHD